MRGVLVIVLALAGCGSDGADSISSDMSCFYGQVSGTCTLKGSTVTGTCFESPRCECVFPEAVWVCCYAGYGDYDGPGKRVGDPCCGPTTPNQFGPGYPCFCDGTRHWTCPFDLGATD